MSVIDILTDFDGLWYGIGFRQVDKDVAQKKMEQAKALGSRYAEARCLFEGWNCEKNEEAAVALFQELAEEGDERAQFMLGICLYGGTGIIQDYADAVSWFRKSCHAEAYQWLGSCYYSGLGVTLDYKEAVKWFRKAAEQGHSLAQYYLGRSFWYGYVMGRDYVEAVKWLRMAHWSDPGRYIFALHLATCLHDAAEALLETGDRIESAELLWASIQAKVMGNSHVFWTKTLPPLRLLAARAVVEAGEPTAAFHIGIVEEVELVRRSLKEAGFLPDFKCTTDSTE